MRRRLDSLQQRESVHLKPGRLLLCIQGDNWFKRVSYTLHVHCPFTSALAGSVQALQASEQELLQERHSLGELERRYREVRLQCSWLRSQRCAGTAQHGA